MIGKRTSRRRRTRKVRSSNRTQLGIEILEDRRVLTTFLESQAIGKHQIIFLDFDGEDFDGAPLGGADTASALPLSSYLSNWGLSLSDEEAVVNAIVDAVEENIVADILAHGSNPNFNVEILSSFHYEDLAGRENVSRVIIGGGAELEMLLGGYLGEAESEDVGNDDTEDSAAVSLDKLSDPSPTAAASLNNIPIDPTLTPNEWKETKIDLIGTGVGNVVSHEIGHLLGLSHSNDQDSIVVLMDTGSTSMGAFVGLVGSYWGDGDEVDIDFSDGVIDGQNSIEIISEAMSTGMAAFTSPRITRVAIAGPNAIDGLNGRYAIPAGSGQSQLKTVPIGGADIIEITFTEEVLINGAALSIVGTAVGNISSAFIYQGFGEVTNTGIWEYTPSIAGDLIPTDRFTLTLDGRTDDGTPSAYVASTTNSALLDGEWASNPTSLNDANTSIFPSGNGAAGGSFAFSFTILPGDANLDNTVNRDELVSLMGNTDITRHFRNGDFTGDSIADNDDVAFIAAYTSPMITSVAVSSSKPTNNDGVFDFARPSSLYGTQLLLPNVGGGRQLRSIPIGGADTITLKFSEDVDVNQNDIGLYGVRSDTDYSSELDIVHFHYDEVSFVATWTFDNDNTPLTAWQFPADQYEMTLSGVTDFDAIEALDGDWDNPDSFSQSGQSSVFPSGNGTAGENFVFFFTILPGDVNRDNTVGAADSAILFANWAPSATGKDWNSGDFTGDGAVGAADSALLFGNWNPSGAGWTEWPGQGSMQMASDGGPQLTDSARRDLTFAAMERYFAEMRDGWSDEEISVKRWRAKHRLAK